MKFSEEKAAREHERQQKKFTETDLNKILEKADEIESKFKSQGRLTRYWEDFKTLLSMIRDYFNGNYREIPWYTISSVGATLLYVLSPIDLIPDFIPLIGYIDDATIFGFCLKMVTNDVAKYKAWKNGS